MGFITGAEKGIFEGIGEAFERGAEHGPKVKPPESSLDALGRKTGEKEGSEIAKIRANKANEYATGSKKVSRFGAKTAAAGLVGADMIYNMIKQGNVGKDGIAGALEAELARITGIDPESIVANLKIGVEVVGGLLVLYVGYEIYRAVS